LDDADVKVLPETHSAMPELSKRFGDHTFFLDRSGLNIVEPTAPEEPGRTKGVVVNLASWSDAGSDLEVHPPEETDIILELGGPDK
jgi:hypothetical protein